MTLSPADIGRLLVALALLLSAAHGLGYVFTRFRQPRVIGEILGGLLLGPTVFGALLPEFQAAVFSTDGSVPLVLDAIYQLGLLLLMFSAGVEIRATFHAGERRTVAWVSGVGTVLPFLAGMGLLAFLDLGRSRGPAATDASFLLVFAIAIAVTNIGDLADRARLGILETSFARIVLAVAVLEDVILYVLLAIALGLAARGSARCSGYLGCSTSTRPGLVRSSTTSRQRSRSWRSPWWWGHRSTVACSGSATTW
jgi:Kef-type K+ transport system membrane component KefB